MPLLCLARFQRHGHRPIAIAGDYTARIGDPSGRSEERILNSEEAMAGYVQAIRAQLERLMDFEARGDRREQRRVAARPDGHEMLRRRRQALPGGRMLGKDSVRSRMDGDGISYTEFSYMLLQAYDFLHLKRTHGCTVQIGGSDQYGNITAGIELIRRADGDRRRGMTVPLITRRRAEVRQDRSGAVWLDPRRTSPYAFYQFWINTDDRDACRI